MSKYSDITLGKIEALINIIGEENVNKLLKDEIKINFEQKMLFAKNGRRIPNNLLDNICDEAYGRLKQPGCIHYSDRLEELNKYIDTGIGVKKFEKGINQMLDQIRSNPQISNILNKVWLPIIMPKLKFDDLGETLNSYLSALELSFKSFNKNKYFVNYLQDFLSEKIGAVDESRYDKLINQMKEKSVIAIYFPNCLQGFSIDAARQQMLALPKGFILSGIDVPIATIMYPDVLVHDWSTPELSLSALYNLKNQRRSFFLKIAHVTDDRHNLIFHPTDYPDYAKDYASSGLLYIGE